MATRIVYCHCAYARVVPVETKAAVLEGLMASGADFEAVPDLCEMSARRDRRLGELAAGGPLSIAACYPRAVRWLFAAAGANISDSDPVVCNMRIDSAEQVLQGVLAGCDGGTPAGSGDPQ